MEEISATQAQPLQIGVVLKTLVGFWEPIMLGANRAIGELEVPGVVVAPSEATPEAALASQLAILSEQRDNGYNALGVAPMAADVSAEIAAFADFGAPVVTIDGDLAESRRDLYIGTINREAGETSAETLLELMPATSGTVVLLGHDTEEWPDGYQRTMGAKELLEQRVVLGFVPGESQRTIEVPASEYETLVARLSADPSQSELLSQVRGWALESTACPLERLAEQAKALDRRLGKGELEVVVEAAGVRLEPELWRPFFAELVHLIRNAVDHGIEGPDEREQRGKSPGGRLVLAAHAEDDVLSFEVSDDGRGIDWGVIRSRGRSLGLPHSAPGELLRVLCHPGVTTRGEVSDTSGRAWEWRLSRAACGACRAAWKWSRRTSGRAGSFASPWLRQLTASRAPDCTSCGANQRWGCRSLPVDPSRGF